MAKAPRYLVSNGLVIGSGARNAFDLNNLYVVQADDYDKLARDFKTLKEGDERLYEIAQARIRELEAAVESMLCEDCPPKLYQTDETRCLKCPRRARNAGDGK